MISINKRLIMSDECIFVILGATGDLAKRKLIPAIYQLVRSGGLCNFAILGVSLIDSTGKQILEQGKEFIPFIDDDIWQQLEQRCYYYKMDFHDNVAYAGLHDLIKNIECTQKLVGNRLFYFATMPHHFDIITTNLQLSKIAIKNTEQKKLSVPWTRIVYEKPFGYDFASARRINKAVRRIFDESQVFRVDHYLGKELVANIALVRFTNRILEPLWNNKHIDSVQIILSEKFGVNNRGAFYDRYGALKDVVQNHVLQILALIAMEEPEHLSAHYLRDAKAYLLSKIKVESVILGQYNGYKTEKDVAQDSTTETYAALKLSVNNRRWKGVPFYIKAGKNLDKSAASVHIKFKMSKCLLDVCPQDSNYLTMNIQPDEGFYLELNVKEPGFFDRVIPICMNFSHSSLCGPNTPAAYEVLLADVIRGDHFAFVRFDEIEYAWKIIDQVKKIDTVIYPYVPGSKGPEEVKYLDMEKEIIWRT